MNIEQYLNDNEVENMWVEKKKKFCERIKKKRIFRILRKEKA